MTNLKFDKKHFQQIICEIANDNAEGQTIVSGDVEGVNNLQEILKKQKKIYSIKC